MFLTPLVASLAMALVMVSTKVILEPYLNTSMLMLISVLYGIYTYVMIMMLIDSSFIRILIKLQMSSAGFSKRLFKKFRQ